MLIKFKDIFLSSSIFVFLILISFIFVGFFVYIVGGNPLFAIGTIIKGAFWGSSNVGYTLYFATNFIFTGLAVAYAFQAGMFNIGGEGQAYIGGVAASIVVLSLDHFLPGWIVVILAIIAALIFAGLWGAIPGVLKAFRGSHEVINTIMLNFIASSIAVWIITNLLIEPSNYAPESRFFASSTNIPTLANLLALLNIDIASSPLNITFFLALFVALGLWFFLYRTPRGLDIRILGKSDIVAVYAGVPIKRVIVTTMFVSGAMAGMMSINELVAVQHKIFVGFTAGAGFTGIAVSIMGKNNPIGVIFAAILFGALQQGGTILSFDMPQISRDMVVVIQGIVIFFAAFFAFDKDQSPMKFFKRKKSIK